MKISLSYGIILLVLFVGGCASSNNERTLPNRKISVYTSSFPTQNVSFKLQQIQQSLRLISSTALYDTYYMGSKNLTPYEVKQMDLDNGNFKKRTIDKSKEGTAVSILGNEQHTAFITARHVITFNDTLIVYKKGKNIADNKFIATIAFKKKQRNYIIKGPRVQQVQKVAQDRGSDLAIVKTNRADDDNAAPPLHIPFGKPSRLRVGSFLFILGYPFGTPMVTRGIVSDPNYDSRGSFLTDALFNHGISGGLIIATNNNFNSFEWVGMAVTASATEQRFLIPKPTKKDIYNDLDIYTDTAYVYKKKTINYGITNAKPANQIQLFIIRNENKLNKLGLSITDFDK